MWNVHCVWNCGLSGSVERYQNFQCPLYIILSVIHFSLYSYLVVFMLVDMEVVSPAPEVARVHLDRLPVGVHIVVPEMSWSSKLPMQSS